MMKCGFFPCHTDLPEDFSCEFCYCPEYENHNCSGKPKIIITKDGKSIKDCSGCTVNHTGEYIKNFYKNGGKDGFGKATSSKIS